VPSQPVEPFAAKLHFLPRVVLKPIQSLLVRVLRRYFTRAPGWMLLTTTGRKTGLPREVLLPCERTPAWLYTISTYGRRSDWMRNIERDPRVRVTAAGWSVPARAEIVNDVEEKRAIVSARPFFPAMPIGPLNLLHRTLLRWPTVAFLRWWVTNRPVVRIQPLEDRS
jgi:deazaflavin-dependent oxidoreductase (nitroreductase family)